MDSVLQISSFLPTDFSMHTISYAMHIWANAATVSYFLEGSRLRSFAAEGLAIDSEEVRNLAGLGYFAVSADEISCFCCRLRCRLGRLLNPQPHGRNNPGCPLQAARIQLGDVGLFADFLCPACLPKLPPLASLRGIVDFLTGERGRAVVELFPRDSVLFRLAELRLVDDVDLAEVTSEQLIGDLNRANTGQGGYYPTLDDESSFAAAFCQLVPQARERAPEFQAGGGLIQPPVELPVLPGGGPRIANDPVNWLL